MSGALEQSVTLEDVLGVVGAKRVPLAPELAGYLALEIAESADEAAGEVDPRAVYIGDEGTVALVRKREAANGSAEESIRSLLLELLDASGSQTPALGAAAKKRAGGGVPGLVEELEAALIPVNRAAGRRALARLAREVKRVTLGVGRNASAGEVRRGSSPSYAAPREVREKPAPRAPAPSRPAPVETREAPMRREAPAPVAVHDASELPTTEFRKDQHLVPVAPARSPEPFLPSPSSDPPKATETAVARTAPRAKDEVDNLLAAFEVSGRGEQRAARELKALVGLDPTPPPPGSDAYDSREAAPPSSEPLHGGADVESLLAISDPGPSVSPKKPAIESPPTSISPTLASAPFGSREGAPASRPMSTPQASVPDGSPAPPTTTSAPAYSEERSQSAPTGPSMRKLASIEMRQPRAPRLDRAITTIALVALAGGAIAIWALKPGFFTGRTPDRVAAERAQAEIDRQQAAVAIATPRCNAALVVTDVPQNAEVLLRVGQAPSDVERMPVGARLEFVATAEGFAPKRTVVPAGASWDPGQDGKPRFEVAVQLDKSRAKPGAVDAWPPGEPGSEVGGKGAPGTVHLVSTPRGAELWLLAGLGPEARIDQLKCGADVDVLVAGPTTFRERLHVASSDFRGDAATRTATVSAKPSAPPGK